VLRCGDLDADAGTLAIRLTKSGKPRFATLTEEGIALFSRLAAGRGDDEFMLRKRMVRHGAKASRIVRWQMHASVPGLCQRSIFTRCDTLMRACQ
jgi:hypothetical protein